MKMYVLRRSKKVRVCEMRAHRRNYEIENAILNFKKICIIIMNLSKKKEKNEYF